MHTIFWYNEVDLSSNPHLICLSNGILCAISSHKLYTLYMTCSRSFLAWGGTFIKNNCLLPRLLLSWDTFYCFFSMYVWIRVLIQEFHCIFVRIKYCLSIFWCVCLWKILASHSKILPFCFKLDFSSRS